jgi:hypothetical protein
LFPGAGLALLFGVMGHAPLIGFIAVLYVLAYFAAYYCGIVSTTIGGKNEMPEWPGPTSFFDDIARPVQMAVVFLLSCLPGMAYAWTHGAHHVEDLLDLLLEMVGTSYFPMGCIAVVMVGTLESVLPHRVVPAIMRCLPGYLVPMAFLFAAKLLTAVLDHVLSGAPAVFSSVLVALAWFYLLIIQARITGLTGRRFRWRINWG